MKNPLVTFLLVIWSMVTLIAYTSDCEGSESEQYNLRVIPIDLPVCDEIEIVQHGQYQVVDKDGFTVSWNNTYRKALQAAIKIRGGTVMPPVEEVKCIIQSEANHEAQ